MFNALSQRMPAGLRLFNRVDYLIATAANASITFTSAPEISQGTPLKIWKNGLLMFYGVDYTLAGNKATFTIILTIGDKICADYWSAQKPVGASVLTGVRTFATFNPADIGSNLALTNGNLTLRTDGTGDSVARLCRTTIALSATKKYYWEDTLTSGNLEAVQSGLATASQALGGGGTQHFLGEGAQSVGGPYSTDGKCYYGNAVVLSAGTVATGSIVGHRYDGPGGKYEVTLDGSTWQTVTSSGVNLPPYYVAGEVGRTTAILTLNLGASAFHWTVPSGFLAGVYTDT